MIETANDLSLRVTVTDKATMDAELNAAVEMSREKAMHARHGVLITRHASDLFTVSVSEEVPYGTTQEKHAW
ncbi:hypothetical protein IV500_06595 [Paeniglutamicibacter antarcticus]|uniref:Uncharacterized protein n=1 Tax=Arthrobacter terrae TaxID=2935737 RepID=A0A931CLB7_9MICC|nr:hypothetical protein [Arthrobacter terrae]MBG0739067.1 hypothetical protein [Arthrobacter terrae]